MNKKPNAVASTISRRHLVQGIAAGLPLVLSACTYRAVSAVAKPSVLITLTGQVLMEHSLCHDRYPGLEPVMAEIQRGDVAFTDLEVAIRTAASGEPTRDTDLLHAATPEVLDCVSEMGFNLLALSNNHAWDLGTAGVLATRDAVAAAGFGFAGTGPDLAQATAAGFAPGTPRVALVSMATEKIREGAAATARRAGVNELRKRDANSLEPGDVERNLAAVRAAREQSDYIIVYLHNHDWGDDMAATKPWAREFARACVDAGADVFASHGAPLLHGLEIYHGKPLFHDLGGLVFHTRKAIGHYASEVWESLIVHVRFVGGELQGIEFVPVALNDIGSDPERHLETRGRPRLAAGIQAENILRRFASLSEAMGTQVDVRHGRGYWLQSAF